MRVIENTFAVLWNKAVPTLTLEELDTLSGASEQAEDMTRQLAVVAEGVACLVAEDSSKPAGAGNFQDGNQVSDLLCNFANHLSVIQNLMHVSAAASYEADKRRGLTT
jgi:hypothetical protein